MVAASDATQRLTISLPASLLQAVDRELIPAGETRSAYIRGLLDAALRQARERADVERYIRGYTEQPQSEAEFGWADQAAGIGLAAERWEQ
jgi:metal-responsive CopG/Arc/MetJ family transcriptional regulator